MRSTATPAPEIIILDDCRLGSRAISNYGFMLIYPLIGKSYENYKTRHIDFID